MTITTTYLPNLVAAAGRFGPSDAEVWPEPTVADLEAIEAEWPLLAAEVAVVEAQCRFLTSPDALARRHLRRAVSARDRAAAVALNRSIPRKTS